MSDGSERYVPSWCKNGGGRTQRTRFRVVQDGQGPSTFPSEQTQGEDRSDAEFLEQLPQRIVTPAFPMERKRGEIPFHIPHSRMLAERKRCLEVPETSADLRQETSSVVEPKVASSLMKIKEKGSVPQRARPADLLDIDAVIHRVKSAKGFTFIYLIPLVTTNSDYATPYSFREVPYNEVNKKYYLTMSSAGVITHDGSHQHFTKLDKWERDFHLYQKLSQIRTLKLFRLWKGFLVWRKHISWRKQSLAREHLTRGLFILDPVLRDTLTKVVSRCLELQRTSFPELSRVENFQLQDFLNLQSQNLSAVVGSLHDFHTLIIELVLSACETEVAAQESARLQNKKRIVTTPRKGRPTQMSYIEQCNRKRLCSKLCRLVYLVGLSVVGVYREAVRNSYNAMSDTLQRHLEFLPSRENLTELQQGVVNVPRHSYAPQTPFFHVRLVADPSSLLLRPSEPEFNETFRKLLDLWVSAVLQLPEIVTDPQLVPFTRPVINGKRIEGLIGFGPSLLFAIETDDTIQALDVKIMNQLKQNFEALNFYLVRLEHIHMFYVDNMETIVDDMTQETDPGELRNLLKKFHAQIDAVKGIANKQPLGFILLHLEEFKMAVLPSCTGMLKAIEQTIPALGSEKIQHLIKECTEATEYLELEPKSTLDFVAYLEFMAALTDRFVVIDGQVDYVNEIYEVVKEFGVPCASDDLEAHSNFKTLLASLKNLWENRVEEQDEIIGKLSRQIGKDIAALIEEILAIHDEIKQDWLIARSSNPEECMVTLHLIAERLTMCQKRAMELRGHQRKFQLEVARFTELDDALGELRIRQMLWETLEAWNHAIKEYRFGDFNAVHPDSVAKFVAKTLKSLSQVEKSLAENEITADLKAEMNDFQARIPVMTHLRNPALKPRHWLRIETLLGRRFVPGEPFNLDTLEACGVLEHVEELEELAAQASSEAALEGLLKRVEASWQDLELTVLSHRDSKDAFILGGLEEVQQVLDDSFIHVNTILSSRHVGPIKARVQAWHKSLNLFSKTMDEWSICQTNWLYLESIFSTPDIQRQLPTEGRLFMIVDRTWKEIMRRTKENPLAMQAATTPGTLEALENNNHLIDQILKCLEAYLESKRVVFPRFYFLSNEELLEILAQTRNPHAVQPHLGKCFDAIKRLEFAGTGKDGPTLDIVAMVSPEGETVIFQKTVKARGNVEDWLGKVEDVMVMSLRKALKNALVKHDTSSRHQWVLEHPAQVILAASQIVRCERIHSIFEGTGDRLAALKEFEVENFDNLKKLAEMVRGELAALSRATLCSLITIDVHARDTVTLLVDRHVVDSDNFEWLKSLRYYWQSSVEDCVVRMSTTCVAYGHEYLGASPRLVVTPLTDKCYLCLMGALRLDLGGAPSGPAGTGKTETTKDLAKALAVQCVVFNCSDSLDFKMMGKFFSGLAQAGAWCCFDEFNRIDVEVLSVIAQQLLTIRNAKVARLPRFIFEGREMKLNSRCAAFITMNPGYAGRTELPDNLKALFRPMAMMIPDYALIAEVILYSEGFLSSKILAHKMTQMYKLCSEQLSQQTHYDFGMRALKSVLVMAGHLKRANPDVAENLVLIRALRDSNIPKFLADDNVLFQGILNDMFPGVRLPAEDYGVLDRAVRAQLVTAQLQPEACTVRKVIQLYETMVVRHGVMLVGPTTGGKTTVLNTLQNALTKLHEDKVEHRDYLPVRKYLMNPKAVTIGELYGEVHPTTLEWRDGILGVAVRTAVQCEEKVHHWIVCDGPVDAIWIENLNTVLDDNKTLCLANSERIRFTQRMCMVFEVQDLDQASPATVSRCGMVYVDPNELQWLPYVKSWLAYRLPSAVIADEDKVYLLVLFEVHVTECLQYVSRNCTVLIHQVNLSKVATICDILQAMFRKENALDKERTEPPIRTVICHCFVFALLWAVGGNIDARSRPLFEQFMRSSFQGHPDARLPEDRDLWSVFVDVESGGFEPWASLMPAFSYDPGLPFFDILVPTLDTVRSSYLMAQLLSVGRGVLFTGHTGVGKSVIAKSVLTTLAAGENYVPVPLSFSAQTSSSRTQEILEANLEKKRKALLGAPVGKRVLVFVDDVNMPAPDAYGSQPPIELLRQYLDFGGFYDREKLFWKDVRDVIVSAACAPPGGGRNLLTSRFLRHFALLAIPPASDDALSTIFQAILRGFFTEFSPAVKSLADSIVSCAIAVYRRAESDLLPTPSKSHYVFNLRDLSKCIQGVLQADPGTLRDPTPMLRLFYHECLRCYQDRLTCAEDKTFFYLTMKELCVQHFGTPVLEIDETTLAFSPPLLIFGDFLNTAAAKEDRVYEEASSFEKLRDIIEESLNDYNLAMNQNMKLVLFQDAVEHCCRIARILRSERGNGLLVGVGGMGKQSATKLASHLNGFRCIQIELTQSYDHAAFQADLRGIYWSAGVETAPTTFLVGDNQILHEEFLEDINNILNSGEVPNLFEGEELEKVIQGMRTQVKDVSVTDMTREDIFRLFLSRAKRRFHLIITMSPVGDSFRRRCRMFPSLVNSCTIDWFMPWPTEALLSVAKDSLRDTVNDALGARLYPICVKMHESAENMSVRLLLEKRRYFYCTPSTYLQLLKVFKGMLTKKSEEVMGLRDRFSNGLQKLYETNIVVDKMKAELVAYEPLLVKKSEATAELMKHLAKEQAAADHVRQVVVADEAIAKAKASETQILADDAQRDLAEALPAMESAMKSLDALNKTDIGELKVFNKPPNLVKVVMEAVCLLFGVKQDWASAKVLLSDVNFLKRLREFDKDHMNDSMLKVLRAKYIEFPDFVPDKVATQSKVCRSLCMWVRALDVYARVYKVVEPKRRALEVAEAELNTIMGVLREKQRRLAEVEAQIAGLEAELDAAVAEKAAVEAAMSLTAARLGRSSRLTTALGDEQARWEDQVQTYTERLQNMVGDILLSAGCVAYFGPFPSDFREELTQIWLETCQEYQVPATSSFSVVSALADAYEVRSWIALGLPQDAVSAENAVLVTRASRWPLMVDPQGQANRWVRGLEGTRGLRVIRAGDARALAILAGAVRTGSPVLIEDVGESIDPALQPILVNETFVQGGLVMIRIGDSEVEYDKNFRLYLTTKLLNPHYLPEICILVTLVNFTVTVSGIEEQLLADVVRLERPDLENARTDLITRINSDKLQLKSIEEKILRMLFGATGNILDDEELIDTLNESRETTEVTAARLEEAEATEARISVARDRYRAVATRGAVLQSAVSQLALVDPMYQYSLTYLSQVFCSVVTMSEKVSDVEEKVMLLTNDVTLAIFTNVSRGLFERHKLMFAFLLCASIALHSGAISYDHWNFFLRGPRTSDSSADSNLYSDLPGTSWASVSYLSRTFPRFKGLTRSLTSLVVTVGDFAYTMAATLSSASNLAAEDIDWNSRLTHFEKLLVIKALSEEKLITAITEFVKCSLGPKFVESPAIGLQSLFQDMSNTTPLVFVLSSGSDPFSALQKFAAERGCAGKLVSVSLGQGQGPVAEKVIAAAALKGDWVFLQNCHLALSWMGELERKFLSLAEGSEKVHSEFRLFLSSMPFASFPVAVLQNAVKVTNEPPRGLRANIHRSLSDLSKDFFEDSPLQETWRRMVFGLCFFHAYIQERKNFGPLGWNIAYEFNDSDREVALSNLKMFCTDIHIPWEALQFITCEITYGGRVTDPWDLRCLKTALHKFFSPFTLESGYKFSSSGIYFCPESSECCSLPSYRHFVEKLPLSESAEVFGLSENANSTYKKRVANDMISAILEMQPKEAQTSGKSNDKIAVEMANLIQSKLIDSISLEEASPLIVKKDEQNRVAPLSTVLLQEVSRFNRLLGVVNRSLSDLKKGVKGEIVMSQQLESVYLAFINNQVPRLWSNAAYPSLKTLSSWVRDLELRIEFVQKWLKTGPPDSFWLPGLFFPQGFLTAVLQTHARKLDIPIDELRFDFIVQDVIISQEADSAGGSVKRPNDGVLVHGLYLEAARWNSTLGQLTDPAAGDVLAPLPVLWLIPKTEKPSFLKRYECPLYKTADRCGSLSTTGTSTNFVMAVLLPTERDASVWVLMGTALLMQRTD